MRFAGLTLPAWIEVLRAPAPPPEVSAADLDIGEAAAIALCLGQSADALLIDESLGRVVTARLGLRTIGILGVPLDARSSGLIQHVAPVLDELERTAGFWVAPSLRVRLLQVAGE